jgi:hypothetical protein
LHSTSLVKSKAIPVHAMEAHGGERRYSSYSYVTSALDGQHHALAALTPRERTPSTTGQEAGWAPEPVWTQRLEKKFSASVRDRTPVVQSVVSLYIN